MTHREGLSTAATSLPGNLSVGGSAIGAPVHAEILQLCSNQTANVPPHEGAHFTLLKAASIRPAWGSVG